MNLPITQNLQGNVNRSVHDCDVHVRILPQVTVHHIVAFAHAVYDATDQVACWSPTLFKLFGSKHLCTSWYFELCLPEVAGIHNSKQILLPIDATKIDLIKLTCQNARPTPVFCSWVEPNWCMMKSHITLHKKMYACMYALYVCRYVCKGLYMYLCV